MKVGKVSNKNQQTRWEFPFLQKLMSFVKCSLLIPMVKKITLEPKLTLRKKMVSLMSDDCIKFLHKTNKTKSANLVVLERYEMRAEKNNLNKNQFKVFICLLVCLFAEELKCSYKHFVK